MLKTRYFGVLFAIAIPLLLAAWPVAFAQAQACSARSGDTVTPVIELYTSEGCSSCPPGDQMLKYGSCATSGVAGGTSVVPCETRFAGGV